MRRQLGRYLGTAMVILLGGASQTLAQDWVIGDDDPNETVVLTADTILNGNLVLINNGHFTISPGVELQIDGDVIVSNTSTMQIDQGTLAFVQDYSYQHQIVAVDTARLNFDGATITASGFSFSVSLLNDAQASYSGVSVVNGYPTWVLFHTSSASLHNCTTTGEFLCWSDSTLDISDSDNVLLWLVTPAGSSIDTTLPAPGDVASFHIGPDVSWQTGIGYSATLSNCTTTNFGLMARSGSSATFHDSELLAAGLYFERSNLVAVQGVANNAHMSDTSYLWGDISLHFVNSIVHAWNFYAYGSTNLTIQSSVIGELLSGDTSQASLFASLCDGAGGHIGADGQSLLVLGSSTNLSETNISGSATVFALNSALLNNEINADDNSLIVLANTEYIGQPEAFASGTIFDGSLDPIAGFVDDVVPIRGSARMIAGPDSPWVYEGYSLDYLPDGQTQWLPITGIINDNLQDSILANWDTTGVQAGSMQVRLRLHHTFGEPFEVTVAAQLDNRCIADFNGDGSVDTTDIIDFFNAWGAQEGSADVNGDGTIDTRDVLAFLNAWAAGC